MLVPNQQMILNACNTLRNRGWTIVQNMFYQKSSRSCCPLAALAMTMFPSMRTETEIKDVIHQHLPPAYALGFTLACDLSPEEMERTCQELRKLSQYPNAHPSFFQGLNDGVNVRQALFGV